MDRPATYASDVAFTEVVKSIQACKGSRAAYERMEKGGSWAQTITPELKAEIEAQTSVFLATANGQGQPYIHISANIKITAKSHPFGTNASAVARAATQRSRSSGRDIHEAAAVD